MMSAKIFSVVSPKGGSGKTVTAINLALVLTGLGKKVLLVDADASTNGLSLFFLDDLVKEKKKMEDEFDSLIGSFEASEATPGNFISMANGLFVIPATYKMIQTEHVDPREFSLGLKNTLVANAEGFDYIFVDAQAGTDEFASIAVKESTEVIIVSEYDPISAQGIERMRILFQHQISGKPTWVLFNKVLPEFASAIGDVLAVARYLNPIPWDADVVRAYVRRRSPIDMDRGNLHTMAVIQTATSLLGREIEADVEDWKTRKERFFKEPVQQELDEIDKNIGDLEERKIKQQYAQKDFERMIRTVIVTVVIMGLSYVGAIYWSFFSGKESTVFQPFSQYSTWLIGISAFIGLAFLILLPFIRSHLFRSKQVELYKEIMSMERNLRDLREKRDKYKSILESDISSLLTKKS